MNKQTKAKKTKAQDGLTETERTWMVSPHCEGLELLNPAQRNEIHNLKTKGYTLENVTPSGNAMLKIHSDKGWTDASVLPSGEVLLHHFDK